MVKKSITTQAVDDDDDHLNKILKKNSVKKNNLHSLIKVLKPKVYITDSSTFKNLVQELTGNGNIGSVSSPLVSSPPSTVVTSKPVEDHEQVVNEMMYNNEDYDFQDSPELSFDSSDHHFGVPVAVDSSPDIMPQTLISGDHEFIQSFDYDRMSSFPVQFEEMESWFLEMESNSVYNNSNCYYDSYALQPVMAPEVCVFDYDLSAIM